MKNNSRLPFDFSKGGNFRAYSSLSGRKLLKFCKPHHHPMNGAEYMRLGTLQEFREAEMGELSDEEEGFYRYHLRFPGKEYRSAEWDQIAGFADGKMSGNDVTTPGGLFSKQIKTLSFTPTSPGFGRVVGEMLVEYSFPNSFIFCLSAANSLDYPSPFESQKERWHLPSNKIGVFAEAIADYIMDMARRKKIVFYYGPDKRICSVVDPSIHIQTRLVTYEKRVVSINPGSDISSVVSGELWKSPFSKPPRFSPELEFRILFFFTDHARPLAIDNDPLFVPFEIVKRHLQWPK